MTTRQAVHIGMVTFACFIGRLSPLMIFLCAMGALTFNLFLLPMLGGKRLARSEVSAQRSRLGLLLYPGVLAGLALLFYHQQVFMAVGWGAMAFGDAAAGIFGPGGRRYIPWQPNKHWCGTAAFFLIGTPLTLGLLWTLSLEARLGLSWQTWLILITGAVLVASLVETVPGLIDDNFSVPIAASLTAYVGYQWLTQGEFFFPSNIGLGVMGITIFSVLSAWSGKIDAPGAFAGWWVAMGIFLGGGISALVLLFLFFVLGTLASSLGKRQKQALGIAQEKGGQRSVRHALANGGVAAMCGTLAWSFPQRELLFLAMLAGALASAIGDTLSSELGNLYGKRYIDILSWRPGQRGDDGVISLEGTLLGVVGSLLMALAAWSGLGLSIFPILIGGVLGNFIDSLLGATLQRHGYMTNDSVNFANTLAGAAIAGMLY